MIERDKDLVTPTKPWNLGKRKPVTDEFGNKWCNCTMPLLSSSHGVGLAYCRKCHNNWYR